MSRSKGIGDGGTLRTQEPGLWLQQQRAMSPDDSGGGEAADAAALELTFLSLDGIKSAPADANHYYAVAWLDPAHKQRARASGDRPAARPRLYFPLSGDTLDDVSSCVTIDVLCPSRFPFHPPRLVGSALLPISSVRVAAGRAAESLALQLRRPSGRVRGTLLVSARILWDLGFDGDVGGFPGAEGDPPVSDLPGPLPDPGEELVQPTAPPLPESDHVSGEGTSWTMLAGGAVVAAVAFLGGVACRRFSV
ncbi:hypothetical protein Taro_023338 [Colocasia esculenta]|uniref:Uncharacterized protein n=1 Tax=Colocasia esculenta TaxID=4460 RepID=A0A843V3W7_COLES|nr:hypothetical protein [Colocasia esculenta]